MTAYYYKARDRSGKVVNGVVCADSEEDALRYCTKKEVYIYELRKYSYKFFSWVGLWNVLNQPRGSSLLKEQSTFFRSLGSLLKAKIPLSEASVLVKASLPSEFWRRNLDILVSKLHVGEKLSKVVSEFPIKFPVFVVPYLEAAERTGSYNKSLFALADLLQSAYDRRHQTFSELVYPITTLIFSIILVVCWLYVWLPSLAVLLQDVAQGDLPWAYRFLFFLDSGLGGAYVVVFILFFLLTPMLALMFLSHRQFGKKWWLCTVFKLPFIGKIRSLKEAYTFGCLLLAMLSHKADFSTVLVTSLKALKNPYLRFKGQEVAIRVCEKGQPLSKALQIIPLGAFRTLSQGIKLGEASGDFLEILSFFLEQVKNQQEIHQRKFVFFVKIIVFSLSLCFILFVLFGLYLPLYETVGGGYV